MGKKCRCTPHRGRRENPRREEVQAGGNALAPPQRGVRLRRHRTAQERSVKWRLFEVFSGDFDHGMLRSAFGDTESGYGKNVCKISATTNAIGVCPQLWRMGNGGSRVEVERV